MTDDADRSEEADGRCIEIDTEFYRVQVWGDPEDSFGDVLDKAEAAANRAKGDAVELDDRIDDDERTFR